MRQCSQVCLYHLVGMCDNHEVHTDISKTWRARGVLTFSRHGLLLKGVALSIYHDEEFDSTTMCCLCSMVMFQHHALLLNSVEMSIAVVSRVTGNVIAIEFRVDIEVQAGATVRILHKNNKNTNIQLFKIQ